MKKLIAIVALGLAALGLRWRRVRAGRGSFGAGDGRRQHLQLQQPPAAAAATPTVNKGDVAWMMTSTLLVIFMAVPGLALFYGGLVRSKNMLSVLMQVLVVFSLIGVLWAVYGYSLAFGGEGLIIADLGKLFLNGVTVDSLADTFTADVKLPEYVFIAFQATFAGITCALIVGSFAERIRFSAVLMFAVLWFTLLLHARSRTWSGAPAATC